MWISNNFKLGLCQTQIYHSCSKYTPDGRWIPVPLEVMERTTQKPPVPQFASITYINGNNLKCTKCGRRFIDLVRISPMKVVEHGFTCEGAWAHE